MTTDRGRKFSNIQSYVIDAKEADYLYVQASQITNSGRGLYTAINIYKEEIIAVFKGELLLQPEAKRRLEAKSDHYFINLPDGTVLDSMHKKCFAKYANDANGKIRTVFKNNALISLDEQDRPCIIASRNIKNGEEIFCDYGKSYWKNRL